MASQHASEVLQATSQQNENTTTPSETQQPAVAVSSNEEKTRTMEQQEAMIAKRYPGMKPRTRAQKQMCGIPKIFDSGEYYSALDKKKHGKPLNQFENKLISQPNADLAMNAPINKEIINRKFSQTVDQSKLIKG